MLSRRLADTEGNEKTAGGVIEGATVPQRDDIRPDLLQQLTQPLPLFSVPPFLRASVRSHLPHRRLRSVGLQNLSGSRFGHGDGIPRSQFDATACFACPGRLVKLAVAARAVGKA